MEWVLIISIFWSGAHTQIPTTTTVDGLSSAALCEQAKSAVEATMAGTIEGGQTLIYAKAVCLQRK
jgi:hypothetical protein